LLIAGLVAWRRWRGRRASDSAGGTTDQGTRRGTSTATGDSTDRSTSAGADQSAANRTLARVIRVGAGGDCQCHPDRQRTWCNKPFHREISSFV
jgi:hypothetical protein